MSDVLQPNIPVLSLSRNSMNRIESMCAYIIIMLLSLLFIV